MLRGPHCTHPPPPPLPPQADYALSTVLDDGPRELVLDGVDGKHQVADYAGKKSGKAKAAGGPQATWAARNAYVRGRGARARQQGARGEADEEAAAGSSKAAGQDDYSDY